MRYKSQALHLTRREFSILWMLASHPGKVLQRREVLEKIWGLKEFVEPRTIDAHVVKVRRKLKDLGIREIHIETIWGIGYRLQANR